MQIPNYYQILEIKRDASESQIKRAFRILAKKYHPDKIEINDSADQNELAEQMFRDVLNAYDVLSDEKRKSEYDRRIQNIECKQKRYQSYYDRLNQINTDWAKLEMLFHALLHRNYETGISMYEQLCKKCENNGTKWCIDDFFNYEDSRDCEFLIAEAYHDLGFSNGDRSNSEQHRKIEQAMHIYESLLSAEGQRPCFKHFIKEVKDRLKRIYLYHYSVEGHHKMCHVPLSKIQELNLPKRETAWMYKKIAEFYVEIDLFPHARQVLLMAFELQPNLAGAKKICRVLNIVNQGSVPQK